MDTTTLSFACEGGAALGAHGHSKDHRPDLKQMVLAVVLDGEGRPLCTEMLPGNTADVTCRSSTGCAPASPSAGCASLPTAA
jgi:transposase